MGNEQTKPIKAKSPLREIAVDGKD